MPIQISDDELKILWDTAFAEKIPGIKWAQIQTECQQLLSRVQNGGNRNAKGTLVAKLNWVLRKKADAERKARENRGIGLTFSGSGLWQRPDRFDGWTEPKPTTPNALVPMSAPPGKKQPAPLPSYALDRPLPEAHELHQIPTIFAHKARGLHFKTAVAKKKEMHAKIREAKLRMETKLKDELAKRASRWLFRKEARKSSLTTKPPRMRIAQQVRINFPVAYHSVRRNFRRTNRFQHCYYRSSMSKWLKMVFTRSIASIYYFGKSITDSSDYAIICMAIQLFCFYQKTSNKCIQVLDSDTVLMEAIRNSCMREKERKICVDQLDPTCSTNNKPLQRGGWGPTTPAGSPTHVDSRPGSSASASTSTPSQNKRCRECRNSFNSDHDKQLGPSCPCVFHKHCLEKLFKNGQYLCGTCGPRPQYQTSHVWATLSTPDIEPILERDIPATDREHDASLGIENSTQNTGSTTQIPRNPLTGTFATKDICSLPTCRKPVNKKDGFATLLCGHHYVHWEAPYHDWLNGKQQKKCPQQRCKKVQSVKCQDEICQNNRVNLYLGCFETGCYCNSTNEGDCYHADELQELLIKSKGKCPSCSNAHPGFCLCCEKLFVLTSKGREEKVLLNCCYSFYHLQCWYKPDADRSSCPQCKEPVTSVLDIVHKPICGKLGISSDYREYLDQLPDQPLRGRIGGRPVKGQSSKSCSRASSRASTSTTDPMPHEEHDGDAVFKTPALPLRRSQRISQSSATTRSVSPATPARLQFDEVTNMCVSGNSKHFGLGCAAIASNHLPPYYNSLAKGSFKCPHCAAWLIYSEAHGGTAYSKCCAKGKVNLQDRFERLQARTPELQAILNNRDERHIRFFRELMRRSMDYIDAFSFGNVMLEREQNFPPSHRIVKVNNMIHFMIWDFRPPAADMPLMHGQLFTIPPQQVRERLDQMGAELKLNPELMEYLHRMLRRHHPLAQVYQTAAETYEQLPADQQLRFRLHLVDTSRVGHERPLSMGPQDDRQPVLDLALDPADAQQLRRIHPGRLNAPNEMGSKVLAQIYLDTGANVPPTPKWHIVLAGRAGTGFVTMPPLSEWVDPTMFSLPFCSGQPGYEGGIPLVGHEKGAKPGNKDDSSLLDKSTSDPEEDQAERAATSRGTVTMAQWYRFMSQIRGSTWTATHWLWDWAWGTFGQLYTVTFNNRRDCRTVAFQKRNQKNIVRPRALLDWLEKLRNGQGLVGPIGRAYFTNEHIRGSRQFYQRKFADAMALFRQHGSPNLFITFTQNTESPELQEMLPLDVDGNRQQWYDRPDIVCRLFIDKRKEFMKDLFERQVMGPVKCGTAIMEFQKRGLPHLHVLLTLDWDRIRAQGRIATVEDYIGQYICAEIPDRPKGRTVADQRQRELYDIITTNNMHTCSVANCIVNGKCHKRFPKEFSQDNYYTENHYCIYKRRPPPPSEAERLLAPAQYGNFVEYTDARGNHVKLTNQHVVSYNAFLSSKYRAHINVEYCSGLGCLKYLTKYVMKGADMAFVELTGEGNPQGALKYDEFHQMRLARYVTSMEAYMALNDVPLVWMSEEVDELDVHGPEGRRIAVKRGKEEETAEELQRQKDLGIEQITQLNAYFTYNRDRRGNPLGLTYATCYQQLWFDLGTRQWKQRDPSRPRRKICRLKTVSPSNLELLAIRTLLFHVRDPKGWEDLRTVNDNLYPTFMEAAKARGLFSDTQHWSDIIQEHLETRKKLGQRIRWLAAFFATAKAPNATEILENIMASANQWLVTSRVAGASLAVQRQYVLRALEWFLRAHGVQPDEQAREDGSFETACEHVGLPAPDVDPLNREDYLRLFTFPDDIINSRLRLLDPELAPADRSSMADRYDDIYRSRITKANPEQAAVVDAIFEAVNDAHDVINKEHTKFSGTPRYIFVTGEGGCGKSWTFNTAVARMWRAGLKFLPLATTGVAANELFGGQTVHKRLCRAKHVDDSTPVNVDLESNFAYLLQNIDGILIDEISMQHRHVLEYVDRMFRAVAPTPFLQNTPFGGKAIILGGDWRQLLPVISGGSIAHQLAASVKFTELFKNFTTMRLQQNMRLGKNQELYRAYIRRIANGSINDSMERTELPESMCLFDREDLVKFVFPDYLLKDPLKEENWKKLTGRAILTPLNIDTLSLNNTLMDRFNGQERVYTGITRAVPNATGADELAANLSEADIENLTNFTPPGIPEHRLRVRVGCIMMLIHNISVADGLCNGTRIQVLANDKDKLSDHLIHCRVLNGSAKGEERDIHPIRFEFGGDPNAPHEGTIKAERIQFPLRPGSVMTINKAQAQTLSHVGLLLDTSQCFSHGQLYTAMSRVTEGTNIAVCISNPTRRVRNPVIRDILDPEDLLPGPGPSNGPDGPPDGPSDDGNNPYPTGPPPDIPPDEIDQKPRMPRPTPVPVQPLSLHAATTRDHLRTIDVVLGNIVRQPADMIVNAANRFLKMGRGVDGEIHFACQPEMNKLVDALKQHHQTHGDLPDGQVVVTDAYGGLCSNAKKIAHAVGPQISPGSLPTPADREALQNCYTNALNALVANGGKTITIPCISMGVFAYPRVQAATAALEAILEWLTNNPQSSAVEKITLVVSNPNDQGLYKDLLQRAKRQIVGSRTASRASSRTTSRAATPVPNLTPKTSRKTPAAAVTTTSTAQIAAPSTSSYQAPTPSVRGVYMEDNIGIGDCFFHAICYAVYRRHNQTESDSLRGAFSHLLNRIVLNNTLFPRGLEYDDQEQYLEHLRRAYVPQGDPGRDRLHQLRLYAHQQGQPTVWASVYDAELVSMLLRQPIVIIRPHQRYRLTHLFRPKWDQEQYQQIIYIYFPDGFRMEIDRTMPLDEIHAFVARNPDTGFERRVDNAIVLWYNGVHFQTIMPSTPPPLQPPPNLWDIPAVLFPGAQPMGPVEGQQQQPHQPPIELNSDEEEPLTTGARTVKNLVHKDLPPTKKTISKENKEPAADPNSSMPSTTERSVAVPLRRIPTPLHLPNVEEGPAGLPTPLLPGKDDAVRHKFEHLVVSEEHHRRARLPQLQQQPRKASSDEDEDAAALYPGAQQLGPSEGQQQQPNQPPNELYSDGEELVDPDDLYWKLRKNTSPLVVGARAVKNLVRKVLPPKKTNGDSISTENKQPAADPSSSMSPTTGRSLAVPLRRIPPPLHLPNVEEGPAGLPTPLLPGRDDAVRHRFEHLLVSEEHHRRARLPQVQQQQPRRTNSDEEENAIGTPPPGCSDRHRENSGGYSTRRPVPSIASRFSRFSPIHFIGKAVRKMVSPRESSPKFHFPKHSTKEKERIAEREMWSWSGQVEADRRRNILATAAERRLLFAQASHPVQHTPAAAHNLDTAAVEEKRRKDQAYRQQLQDEDRRRRQQYEEAQQAEADRLLQVRISDNNWQQKKAQNAREHAADVKRKEELQKKWTTQRAQVVRSVRQPTQEGVDQTHHYHEGPRRRSPSPDLRYFEGTRNPERERARHNLSQRLHESDYVAEGKDGKMSSRDVSPVRTGFSQEQLKYLASGLPGHSLDLCPICHERMRPFDDLVSLPCRHHFHRVCVCRWLEGINTCPVCRNKIQFNP